MFSHDLVGGRSDAPRLPERQLATLYRHDPGALYERGRDRAWCSLVDRDDQPARRRRCSAVEVWGRRFGVAVNMLVSGVVAQLLLLAYGAEAVLWPVMAGAVVGLTAGSLASRAFREAARTSQDTYGRASR